MKPHAHKPLEKYRVKTGYLASTEADGNNGAFIIPSKNDPNQKMVIIVSDASDWHFSYADEETKWEHVSASLPNRCPYWQEMCMIKDMFWDKDETVIQFHPAEKDYVNCYPHCLHLWKPIGIELPKPPMSTVGPKDETPKHD